MVEREAPQIFEERESGDDIDPHTKPVMLTDERREAGEILSRDLQDRAEEHKKVLQPLIDTAVIRFITGWLFPHLDKGWPLTFEDYSALVSRFKEEQENVYDFEYSLIEGYRLSDRAIELLEGQPSQSELIHSLQAEKIINPTRAKNHIKSFTQLYKNDSR